MKRDNLHFRWNRALSYGKTWNFVIGERESGKSVDSWFLIWNAFHYKNRPSIVLRRRIADMTSTYVDDVASVLNKFLDKEKISLHYIKGDIKQGIVDVKCFPYGVEPSYAQIKKAPTFFRVVALSNPMNRIKSLMLENVKYIFFDEFIANLRGGEKYLKANEHFLIQEIYTTYNREATSPIKIIAAGNPYSVYTPLFTEMKVDTSKLKPGSFVVGPDYVIDCFQCPPELKEVILANNPQYQFDDAYNRYAFGGEAINDANIRIQKFEPKGFKLKYVFKVGSKFLSVHRGNNNDNPDKPYSWWCCMHESDWLEKVGKRRKIVVFNFGDMIDGSVIMDGDDRKGMLDIKIAMNKRKITFNCIDAHYMLETVYGVL